MRWPDGIRAGVASCGIKERGLDVGVILADEACAWAGTFTRNAAAAAPVNWSRSLLGSPLRAIVANSGNANACTGAAGYDAVVSVTECAAAAVGCDPRAVAVASTGPIGIPLKSEHVISGIEVCLSDLGARPLAFAQAIMTTDSKPKLAEADCAHARVVGVAKGAAMISPNMATMLAFVVTDAALDARALQDSLRAAVDVSFNRLCIDGCESTNDSVFVLATGRAGTVEAGAFKDSLDSVCRDLAWQIASDAEGSARAVRISVEGAGSTDEAVALGRAVAASALWRAAVSGADPNWGRVVAALGSVDPALDLGEVEVSIGPEQLYSRGEPVGSLRAAAKQMEGDVVDVFCRVGTGAGRALVLSADMSSEYVILNASGAT